MTDQLQTQQDAYRQEVGAAADQQTADAQNLVSEAQTVGDQQVSLAQSYAAQQKPFTEEPPKDQIEKVMNGAPFLFAMAALGGIAGKASGLEMLGSLNGISDGIIKGDQEALAQHWDRYNASYQKWKTNADQQYHIYQTLMEAYGSAGDAKLRALTAAMNMTNDARQMKLQVDDPDRYWLLKSKLEESHAKVLEAQAKMGLIAQESAPLDNDSLEQAVAAVRMDPNNMRQFASFGKAGQVRRDQINARLAAENKEQGISPEDMLEMRARAAAEKGSLNQQVKTLRTIQGFETVARNNGERAIALAAKLDDPDIPIAAAASRLAKRAGGSADAAEFSSVMLTFQTEAARILNNPNLSGQLTDTARKDLQQVVSGTLPSSQLNRVVKRLFTEFDVRKAGINQQISQAQSAVAGKTPEENQFEVGGVYTDANGNQATYMGGNPKDPKSWK